MNTAENRKPQAHIVPGNQRMRFLPRHFGNLMMVAENTTYNIANKLMKVTDQAGSLKPYNGGYWEYAIGPSGAPFMFPKEDQDVEVTNPLSREAQNLSPMVGGIVVSMLTLQAIFNSNVFDSLSDEQHDDLINRYHNLLDDGYDLARDEDERRAFYRLTD